MAGMPAPVTVWMVELGDGRADREDKGTLTLEGDTLVFSFAGTLDVRRFPLADASKATRVRGSPILMLKWLRDGRTRATAFYFVQPPPLRPPDPGSELAERPRLLGRPSRRRHQRTNVRYLQTALSDRKQLIQEWADELTTRMRGL